MSAFVNRPAQTVSPTTEQNVFQMPLDPCSIDGMATTGLQQDGRCAHNEFDARSHPICIHLPTFPTFIQGMKVPGDDEGSGRLRRRRRTSIYSFFYGHNHDKDPEPPAEDNFFTLTGQPNLEQESMPCTNNPLKACPIQHWCVNEKSFASFMDLVGGCQKIGTIVCGATNIKVLEAYEDQFKGGDDKAKEALECLKERCWLR